MPITEDLSSAALAQANEDNVVACYDRIRRTPGGEGDDRPGRLRVATGIAHPIFNGVFRTRLPPSGAEAYIEETLAYFASNGLPWRWWVWPSTEPADLVARLAAHGLVARASVPAMSVDLRDLREDWPWPEGLTVARVANEEMLEEWIRPAAAAFGLAPEKRPRYVAVFSAFGFEESAPLQSYVGHVDGAPVAISQSFLGTDVVGIYGVATLPEYRGRGLGKALTVAPLRDARMMGYRWAILQSTAMGRPVYDRLGFREDCQVQLYGLPPPPSA